MKQPKFEDDKDATTFARFELIDGRSQPWNDVRLSFNDWDWVREKHGTDSIEGYYLNGYGLQGLVLAARIHAGLDAYPEGMEPNSEGDTCYIHFPNIDLAVETASLSQAVITDTEKLKMMVAVARENDLEE